MIVSNPGRLILTRIAQAQQEHDEAKEVFDMLNDQLVAELPQLMDLRVPYFDPSFEAMIRMQSKFAEEGYEKLSGVQRYFADSIRDDYAAGQLDAQVSVLFSVTASIAYSSSGRGCPSGDARTVHLWCQLILFHSINQNQL